jgi:hypothetical protein
METGMHTAQISRIGIDAESEDVIGVYHSDDWSATKRKKNKKHN